MRAAPFFFAAVATALLAQPALAQGVAWGALDRFEPAPSGDAMFGVPSPWVGGHLVPRATGIFDFAYKPLSIQNGDKRESIVSHMGILHLNASFALWDRLLISADMPFVLFQGGDSPVVNGTTFRSPSVPQVGDLRLGARVRLYGDYWDPFQIGVGGYVWMPTAPSKSYAGDGAVRGQPQLLFGGRFTHFVWSLSAGTTLRASAHPHSFDAGAGAAVVLGEEVFQAGPEVTLSVPFKEDQSFSTDNTTITAATGPAVDLLIGAKVRPVRSLVIGAGAGPGLTQAYGTPVLRAVGTIGYEPLPPRKNDRDGDGIVDKEDACPDVRGVKSDDPKKNGCPPDRDGDGIIDVEDACPDVKGVRSEDPKKNGCPPDRDGDGVPDGEDACPDVPGVRSADPAKNGCPGDRDNDGILDAEDACPDVPGVKNADPRKNGCPLDTDEDGIPDAKDACPKEKGLPDPDPRKNGCPPVHVTDTEIVIRKQVRFRFNKSSMNDTTDPVTDDLLTEVRDTIDKHPEITLIEIQGHADEVGDDEYNMRLSERRAQSVRNWLVTRGIAANKLTTRGFGSKVPIEAGSSEAARQANRRVQFVIKEKKAQ